jgi:hypothetical protein
MIIDRRTESHGSGGLESEAVFRIRIRGSVPDPNSDPDPPDPHVFGPPGSGSFYHLAKIVRKTLISMTSF